MSFETLERYVRALIEGTPGPVVQFVWQGGEPTLMGLPFYEEAIRLQRASCPPEKRCENAMQTNGTLIDDPWAAFLGTHDFLVGLSIDGPPDLHDRYRVDRGGHPTHAQVARGLEALERHGVRFNVLTVVNRHNSREPRRVYRYLADLGVKYMQFIPLVEREGDRGLAGPPTAGDDARSVTPWSVLPDQWGKFLNRIFDTWVKRDVGRIFVNIFDAQLAARAGLPAEICVYARECGSGLVLEHNGDIYACDHYVYPDFLRGNIHDVDPGTLAARDDQQSFGRAKHETLASRCETCSHLHLCWGDCPKHRFQIDAGEPGGYSYLCDGYRAFFEHTDAAMNQMLDLLRRGRPPSEICQQRGAKRPTPDQKAPCPCGSGRKYKRCCGAAL